MPAHGDVGNLLLNAARTAPRLDAEQERILITACREGDEASLGRLIICNVRLAIKQARSLRGYGLFEEDLIQEGIVGLLEAASRFDTGREVRFSTYAAWWIRACTWDFVLRNWSIVRVYTDADQKKLFFGIRSMKAKLDRDASVDPASVRSAIASALGVSLRDVEIMDARLSGDISLNAPAPWDEDGEAEIGDNLHDDAPLPDDLAFGAIEDDETAAALKSALSALDEQERLVVQERWLTDDIAPLNALGEFLGMSPQRVKRIEIAAIAKMQGLMAQGCCPA